MLSITDCIVYVKNSPIGNFQPSKYWVGGLRYLADGIYGENFIRIAVL